MPEGLAFVEIGQHVFAYIQWDTLAPSSWSLGIIGKNFVDEARLGKAVALDVGSLMDYMMGHKSRTMPT